MKRYILPLVLGISIGLSSCSKEDDNDPKPAATTTTDPADDPGAIQLTKQLLTATSWQLTGLVQAIPGQATQSDIYNTTFPYCQKDNFYTFETDSKLYIEENWNTCSPSQTQTGSWSLKNSKIITINAPKITQTGLTGDLTIVTLTNNSLVLKQTINGTDFISTYELYHPDPEFLLYNREWVITDQVTNDSLNGVPRTYNSYATMPACQKDDFVTFDQQDMVFHDGTNQCAQAPGTVPYYNIYSGSQPSIFFYYEPTPTLRYSREWYILSLSRKTLIVKEDVYDPNTWQYISTKTTTYTAR